MAAERTASAPLSAGWAQLAAGEWAPARRVFADAVARRETPRGARGAQLGRVVARRRRGVFDARERAYRLYRRRGDGSGAARMATWLAADHLDYGMRSGLLDRARA